MEVLTRQAVSLAEMRVVFGFAVGYEARPRKKSMVKSEFTFIIPLTTIMCVLFLNFHIDTSVGELPISNQAVVENENMVNTCFSKVIYCVFLVEEWR